MQRRRVLEVTAGVLGVGLAGCTNEASEPDIAGEYLASESHPDVDVSGHRFTNTGETTQPYAVMGTLWPSTGNRETVVARVHFLDSNDNVAQNNVDTISDLPSQQDTEFTVRYPGDDPQSVASYELFVDIPNPS